MRLVPIEEPIPIPTIPQPRMKLVPIDAGQGEPSVNPLNLFSPRKTLGEIARPIFGPAVSEAISPTPVGQMGLRAVDIPFEYGISRPFAKATIPSFWEKPSIPELFKGDVTMKQAASYGASIRAGLWSRFGVPETYKVPQLTEALGTLTDIGVKYYGPHLAAKVAIPAYRGAIYGAKKVAEIAPEVIKMPLQVAEMFARETGKTLADVNLSWDFVTKQRPDLPLQQKLSLTLESLRAIREPTPTTAKIEMPLKQLFGVEAPIKEPAIIEKAPVKAPNLFAGQQIPSQPKIEAVAPIPKEIVAPRPPLAPNLPILPITLTNDALAKQVMKVQTPELIQEAQNRGAKVETKDNQVISVKFPGPPKKKPEVTEFEYEGKVYPLEILYDVKNQVEAGGPGTRYPVLDEEGQPTGEWSGYDSSYPQWMQNWNKVNPEKSIGRKDVLGAFEALKTGKKLGNKQKLVLDLMMDEAGKEPKTIQEIAQKRVGGRPQLKVEEPEHIKKGIELSKKLTEQDAFNLALEAYRPYIERGDTEKDILYSQHGQTLGDFEGFLWTGGYVKGEKLSHGKVGVELADGRVFKFKLQDFFEKVKSKKLPLKEVTQQPVEPEAGKIIPANLKDVLSTYKKTHAEHSEEGLKYWLESNEIDNQEAVIELFRKSTKQKETKLSISEIAQQKVEQREKTFGELFAPKVEAPKVEAPKQQTVNDLIKENKIDLPILERNIKAKARKLFNISTDKLDDVAQEVLTKMLPSTYNPAKGKLNNWINSSIEGYVRNAVKDLRLIQPTMGRKEQDILTKINKIKEEKPDITNADIATQVGISEDRVKSILERAGTKVESLTTIEGEQREIAAPEERLSPRAQKLKEIVTQAKSKKELQTLLKKEFGIDVSLHAAERAWGFYKGGPTSIKLLNKFAEKILHKQGKTPQDLGLETLVGNDAAEAYTPEAQGIIGIGKELGHKLNSELNNWLTPHKVIFYDKEARPVADVVVDAIGKDIANRTDALRLVTIFQKAKHLDRLTEILVQADRNNDLDPKALMDKAPVGSFDKSDYTAVESISKLRQMIKDRIVTKLVQGKYGVRIKSSGYRYSIAYKNNKNEYIRRDNLTEKQYNNIKDKYDTEIISRKEDIRLRYLDTITSEYKTKKMLVDNYEEALKEEKILQEDLIRNVLPYKNWIAHYRRGNYWFRLYEVDPDGKEILAYAALFDKESEAKSVESYVKKEMPEANNPQLFRTDVSKKDDNYDIPYMGSPADIMIWLSDTGIDLTDEMAQRIIKHYRSMSPLISHLIKSENIAGWDQSADGIANGMKYSAYAASRDEFRENIKEAKKLLKNVSDSDMKELAANYLNAYLSPTPFLGIIEIGRGVMYFAALTNKLTRGIQNISEAFWAIEAVSSKTKNPFKLIRFLDDELKKLNALGKERGAFSPFFVREAAFSWEKADVVGRVTESWSSKFSFNLGLKLAQENGLKGEDAYKYAYRFLYNEVKPLYRPENKISMLNKKGVGKAVGKYAFPFVTWWLDFMTKALKLPLRRKAFLFIIAIILSGIGGLPFGRRLLKKLGYQTFKHNPRNMTWDERFVLAGLPGVMGVDPRFLNPIEQQIAGLGSIFYGLDAFSDLISSFQRGMDKYGLIGGLGSMALGGLQYPITGVLQAQKGIRKKVGEGTKVVYRPQTTRERVIMSLGLKPFEYGEMQRREKENKKSWWKR